MLTAAVVQIDHLKNHFAGGRWTLLSCELAAGFLASPEAHTLVPRLAQRALSGAEDFSLRPSWPLFLPGEPATMVMDWQQFGAKPGPAQFEIELAAEGSEARRQSFSLDVRVFPFSAEITLPADDRKGLHVVTARLLMGGKLHALYRTGYWIRDEKYLHSGPRVSVNEHYFEMDGRQVLVAGTTYMASDVQRGFFMNPNPYVWDRDMAQIQAAGFNMLRTGWWSAWDQVMKESGVAHEEMLRTLEAFLMTARRHELPVQFTFFALVPEVWGGRKSLSRPGGVAAAERVCACRCGALRWRPVPDVGPHQRAELFESAPDVMGWGGAPPGWGAVTSRKSEIKRSRAGFSPDGAYSYTLLASSGGGRWSVGLAHQT